MYFFFFLLNYNLYICFILFLKGPKLVAIPCKSVNNLLVTFFLSFLSKISKKSDGIIPNKISMLQIPSLMPSFLVVRCLIQFVTNYSLLISTCYNIRNRNLACMSKYELIQNIIIDCDWQIRFPATFLRSHWILLILDRFIRTLNPIFNNIGL